jgi:two-component system, chemotaxis family, chemotaxis protein CheY
MIVGEKSMKVLIADDDPLCRTMVCVSLRASDRVEIIEASDGDQALSLAKRVAFDLVVLDWQMPGKSGVEVAEAIRAAGIRVPILMMTAEAEKQRVIQAIRAGITDYLIKPFEAKVLLAKVERLLQPR